MRYLVERMIPQADKLTAVDLKAIVQQNLRALQELEADIQWMLSTITADRMICLYIADDEAIVGEHARRAALPIDRISILLLMWVPLFAAACAARSEAAIPPREVPPTPGASPTATVAPTAVTPTPDISGFLAMDLAGGDPEQGFNLAIAYQCRSCHDSPSRPDRGPQFSAVDDLPPILARGEVRIADPAYEGQATTSHEYLLESILDPAAYQLPGDWAEVMPATYHEDLTDQDVADLLAWMATFSETAEKPTATMEP